MSNLISATLYGTSAFEGNNVPNSDVEKLKNNKILLRALVVDVITDVSLYDKPPDNLTESDKRNFFKSPRNSLICRLITESSSNMGQDVVCYPFFSSHFSLPVKPGEQVWLINEMLFSQTIDSNRTYWLTRVSDELSREDANFTYFNRKIEQKISSSLPPDRVLEIDSRDKNIATKNVIQNSLTKNVIIREPVPRYTKRPNDLILQGSNNTLISLGQDRGFDFENRPNTQNISNSNDKPKEKSGTIDIVAGRGRYFENENNEITLDRRKNKSLGQVNSTKPFISKNVLGEFETDKNPAQSQEFDSEKNPQPGNSKTNPKEGDPDFIVDASRLYITENSKADKKLGTKSLSETLFVGDLIEKEGPFVAIKSDNIRLVSRNFPNKVTDDKLPESFESQGGTIRLIKEGSEDDRSSLYFEKDGTVQLSGKKVFIGRPNKGSGPGPGGAEPYIKYSEFENLWKNTMDSLTAFCDTVLTHVTPGYGNPSLQINDAANTLKNKLEQIKSDVEKVKSERVFGE
jgi:hypothetical protein